MQTKISSATREVTVSDTLPTVLIGERINPTGKKKMAEALLAGSFDVVCAEALAEVWAGADIIDVNVGAFGVDERSVLPPVVQAVMAVTDVPLCIDSSKPEALEAALKVYRGKALVNSVNGEERSLKTVLPLIKHYGASVVGITQDQDGIPPTAEGRLSVARRIVAAAEGMGIPRENIIIDCLALAVGASEKSALVTIDAVRRVRAELGVNQTLGASNISFGLPGRDLLNPAFLTLVIEAGVTCPIVDVAKVRTGVLAADLLLGRDRRARRYIEASRQRPPA